MAKFLLCLLIFMSYYGLPKSISKQVIVNTHEYLKLDSFIDNGSHLQVFEIGGDKMYLKKYNKNISFENKRV